MLSLIQYCEELGRIAASIENKNEKKEVNLIIFYIFFFSQHLHSN